MNWVERFIKCLYNKQKAQRQENIIQEVTVPEKQVGEAVIRRDPKKMSLSHQGMNLIKVFEGFRADPYQDQAGIWTIGYGSTGKHVHKNSPPITEQDAAYLMNQHLQMVQQDVRFLVRVPLNQNQCDALVSFAYTVGTDLYDALKAEGLGDATRGRKLHKE